MVRPRISKRPKTSTAKLLILIFKMFCLLILIAVFVRNISGVFEIGYNVLTRKHKVTQIVL